MPHGDHVILKIAAELIGAEPPPEEVARMLAENAEIGEILRRCTTWRPSPMLTRWPGDARKAARSALVCGVQNAGSGWTNIGAL